MADFSYEASGGFDLRGCADSISVDKIWTTLFSVGDIVYPKRLAEKGILTKVAIKKITIIEPQQETFRNCASGGVFVHIIYTDNYNARYVEGDLVSLSTGLALYEAFNAAVIASTIANAKKAGCA